MVALSVSWSAGGEMSDRIWHDERADRIGHDENPDQVGCDERADRDK